LKKEVYDLIKKESVYLIYLISLFVVLFKIAFYNDSFMVILRSIFSIFWLFIIPGYFGMLYWHNKLDFIQRALIGSAVAAGLIGTISYYFGLAGLNLKYHIFILPPLIIILGFLLVNMKNKE